jgi:Anti-sigma-K factor rskA
VKAPDFDDLVGRDVPDRERDRLRRVHDMLVAAGPPPELPEALSSPPVRSLRRRRAVALLIAAAIAVAAFAAGWTLSTRNDDSFEVRRAVPMRATENAPGASALIELGYPDPHGNWPMLVTVRGLRPLPEGGYYELLLTKDGRPIATCGSFKVRARGATTVPLNAAYDLRNFDGWVIRPYVHDRPKFNETVVLQTQRT